MPTHKTYDRTTDLQFIPFDSFALFLFSFLLFSLRKPPPVFLKPINNSILLP